MHVYDIPGRIHYIRVYNVHITMVLRIRPIEERGKDRIDANRRGWEAVEYVYYTVYAILNRERDAVAACIGLIVGAD